MDEEKRQKHIAFLEEYYDLVNSHEQWAEIHSDQLTLVTASSFPASFKDYLARIEKLRAFYVSIGEQS